MRLLYSIFFLSAISMAQPFTFHDTAFIGSLSQVVAGGGGSSLLTDLTAYWKLEETSGTRNDSKGSSHLTDYNTVGYTTGKQGNAADLVEANDEMLYCASNSSLELSSDTSFTICLWSFDTGGHTGGLLFKGFGADPKVCEYAIYYDSSSKMSCYCGNNVTVGTVQSTETIPGAEWHFTVFWHDAVADKLYVQIDNGTPTSADWSGGTFTGTADLTIGKMPYYDNYIGARLDEIGFWKRTLTADERTILYNSGSGKTYPFE